jgi:hypothetical protein
MLNCIIIKLTTALPIGRYVQQTCLGCLGRPNSTRTNTIQGRINQGTLGAKGTLSTATSYIFVYMSV